MKQWFKIIVKDAEGWLEGTEFIKAETQTANCSLLRTRKKSLAHAA